jgi:hypothetical protein
MVSSPQNEATDAKKSGTADGNISTAQEVFHIASERSHCRHTEDVRNRKPADLLSNFQIRGDIGQRAADKVKNDLRACGRL